MAINDVVLKMCGSGVALASLLSFTAADDPLLDKRIAEKYGLTVPAPIAGDEQLGPAPEWLQTVDMITGDLGKGHEFHLKDTLGMATEPRDNEKVFVINAPMKDLEEFRQLAKLVSRLKPYGSVEVNISTLAEKGFYEIPVGENFWYEYASYNPTPYKFFPDPKIEPFIPGDFVKKNRELLLEKAKILREYGLKAAFWSYEPNFLPEAFFESYPHMRGARVDHPRRGNHAAFAPCVHSKETQAMYSAMVTELVTSVPEINTFFFKTNDAGSGICWSSWLYTGPNGPVSCQHHSTGENVALLMNTFKEGAASVGKNIAIHLTGSMFTDEEKADIYANLPENCYFQSHNSDEVLAVNSPIVTHYPVRGLFDPLDLLQNINTLVHGDANTVFISFRASYDRDYERFDVMEKFVAELEYNLSSGRAMSADKGTERLKQLCREWAGDHWADQLYNAFIQLRDARKNQAFGTVSGIYWGVSLRHITRPLVVAPKRLEPAEEAYFLPHVFNASREEGRSDYIDIHGARRPIPSGAVSTYISNVEEAIRSIEEVSSKAVPEKTFLRNMANALKINNSILRSAGNFAEAQAIRDSNMVKLNSPPRRPDKAITWVGDPDLQRFNAVMRDELDNTQELIDLLEDGGMELISHAKEPAYEDTFLLGPDLIEQLKQKRKIMIAHWRDIEDYLDTPLK